jgi:hypothetical protein
VASINKFVMQRPFIWSVTTGSVSNCINTDRQCNPRLFRVQRHGFVPVPLAASGKSYPETGWNLLALNALARTQTPAAIL